MREILFRGKRKDNSEWIYGDLLTATDIFDCYEISENTGMGDRYEVIPETVGQYTGLKDKNGRKIFEGDILAFYGRESGIVRYGEGTFDSGIYSYTGFYYEGIGGNKDHTSLYENCGAEVINNVYDIAEYFEENL